MDKETGAWLRLQREERSWDRREMARRIVEAGTNAGDTTMPSVDGMYHNVHRWEQTGGISERHKLYCCRVLGIGPGQFGPGQPAEPGATGTAPGTAAALAVRGSVSQAPAAVAGTSDLAYRGRQEPSPGQLAVGQEVTMAAHEGSDHAAEHEQSGTGAATLEQLREDLVRLSVLSSTGEPFPAFLDMRRVRDRVYRLLDRRQRPREQADLYFLAGCLNGLMGLTANRLGYPDAAQELIRAGWAYASVIDHNGLRGMLRARLSYVMYWRGWYAESRDLAADGLRYAPLGPMGANLQLEHARALARLGDADAARRAVALAHEARESDYSDDVTSIGGEEFALSRATTWSMAGTALAELPGAEHDAAAELETAVRLYEAGPGPGEQHGFASKVLAGTDLAAVRLRSGALDAATTALEPVLALPPGQRVFTLTTRLARVRDELAAPAFRGSPQAGDIGDRIEEFSREAVTAGLHSLSGLS